MAPTVKLNRHERRMLAILHPPGATVAMGLGVGTDLFRRGFVQAKYRRWEATAEGRLAIEGYPAELAAYGVK